MIKPLLSVENLSVSYGPIQATNGVTFAIAPGEVVALLGPNGAGKTSTLAAISGLVPYSGEVRFDGNVTRRRTPEALARGGLIHVPEGRRIFPTLSVHENLQVAVAACHRRTPEFDIDSVYDLFPPLRELRSRGGWALSGGEQQMLAIGRALVGSPRILLLDEPSLGLAPSLVDVVFAALDQLSARVPMLLVEQNTTVALDVCTRALVLSGGEVVMAGTGDELRRSEQLVESYLGQRDVSQPESSE